MALALKRRWNALGRIEGMASKKRAKIGDRHWVVSARIGTNTTDTIVSFIFGTKKAAERMKTLLEKNRPLVKVAQGAFGKTTELTAYKLPKKPPK